MKPLLTLGIIVSFWWPGEDGKIRTVTALCEKIAQQPCGYMLTNCVDLQARKNPPRTYGCVENVLLDGNAW